MHLHSSTVIPSKVQRVKSHGRLRPLPHFLRFNAGISFISANLSKSPHDETIACAPIKCGSKAGRISRQEPKSSAKRNSSFELSQVGGLRRRKAFNSFVLKLFTLAPSSGSVFSVIQKKALVVEDTQDIRLLMCKALKKKGFEVFAYESGTAALDFLESSDGLPDLAFVDLRMPGMEGEEFIERVRQSQNASGLKVILTSAWHNLGMIAEKAGADGFLKKPFDLDELYRLVESHE